MVLGRIGAFGLNVQLRVVWGLKPEPNSVMTRYLSMVVTTVAGSSASSEIVWDWHVKVWTGNNAHTFVEKIDLTVLFLLSITNICLHERSWGNDRSCLIIQYTNNENNEKGTDMEVINRKNDMLTN